MEEWIKKYRDWDINVIPLGERGRNPLLAWEEFKRRPTTQGEDEKCLIEDNSSTVWYHDSSADRVYEPPASDFSVSHKVYELLISGSELHTLILNF